MLLIIVISRDTRMYYFYLPVTVCNVSIVFFAKGFDGLEVSASGSLLIKSKEQQCFVPFVNSGQE